jgi:hypothetical protein
LNCFISNTEKGYNLYGAKVNYTKPNEFKFKGNGDGNRIYYDDSIDKIKVIDEIWKRIKRKVEKIEGQLKANLNLQ